MYLYFNNQGVLKEIINDDVIRQGNHNINKIRFFIEGAEPQIVNNIYKAITFITGVRTFIDVEGNQLTTESFSLTTSELEIPYDKKRELKFFKYFTKYEMFSITVPDDILNESGTVGCRVQMVSAEGIITLGLILFNVEITTGGQAIIEPDTAINIAQWNYLISNMLTPEKYIVKYSADATQWDIVPTEGSTKPVTSGGIATAIANALSAVYKLMGNSTINSLNSMEKSEAMNGYVYNLTNSGDLTDFEGQTISVNVGDNVVFIWDEGDWYWDKLSGIIDTSNLVTINTPQTITGTKSFSQAVTFYGDLLATTNQQQRIGSESLRFSTIYVTNVNSGSSGLNLRSNNIYSYGNLSPDSSVTGTKDLGSSSATWRDLYLSGDVWFTSGKGIKCNQQKTVWFYTAGTHFGTNVNPISSNTYDLGTSTYYWRDLYLAGNITDGTNSIPVANIGKKLYKHTISSNYQDWDNMRLVIVSTDSGACNVSQDVYELLTSRTGNLVSAHLVDETIDLLASVSGYNVISSTSMSVSCISSAGGTPSVVSGNLYDNDNIVDTVVAIN